MFQIICIIIFSIIIIYNIMQYVKIIVKSDFVKTDYISLFIVIFSLFMIYIKILDNNILNILLIAVFLLYTISGYLNRGFDKKGIYDYSHITFLAKFVKWSEIKEIKIEYPEDNKIDVLFVTNTKAFKHRYDEKLEEFFRKIKKKFKI